MSSSAPKFSDIVTQQYFVESQGGSTSPINLLDRFPDTVYSKSLDSVLVKFLYALLGPVGVGQLTQEYLEARLMFEDAGLSNFDLDALYTDVFAFARLAEETYTWDAKATMLTSNQRQQILADDASFRNRAIKYFKGIRAGGTPKGLGLIANSGLNRPVDLVENYKALYDQYADIPLGVPYQGSTLDSNEIIVVPRQEIPRNSKQTLTITGQPVSGYFTLTYPAGPRCNTILMSLLNGSSMATVPNAAQIPPGVFIGLTNVNATSIGATTPTYILQAGAKQTPTSIQMLYPATDPVNGGLPFQFSGSNGSYWAYIGNAETAPIAYNATAFTIQSALQALPVIGQGNVTVTGGPLPNIPVEIEFRNKLGDQPVPTLQPNISPTATSYNGIGNLSSVSPFVHQMVDVLGNTLTVNATVDVDIAGVSADSQTASLNPADEHAMQIGLDKVRPQTSFVTSISAQSTTERQPIQKVFAGSNYIEVLRYEIGNSSVAWPSDDLHWIQSGVEQEAPRPVDDLQHHYQGFHNIVGVTAYTEQALDDPNYNLGTADLTLYWDTMIGRFNPAQVALYPFLAQFQDNSMRYVATDAPAPSPDPLIITTTVNGVGMINNIYPSDYMGLSGQLADASTRFWSSAERTLSSVQTTAIDYLEIDLGTTQAVNYIYFEATKKPYTIAVSYDRLDQAPSRDFQPVTLLLSDQVPSKTSLSYDATATNPWEIVEIHFTDMLEKMIYTRFIRLEFSHTPGNTPFAPGTGQFVPYSVEVRNLRVGRNVSTSSTTFSDTPTTQ